MSFDVAAEAYDRFMGRYSVVLAPQMADLAEVVPDQRVVDFGCGTGSRPERGRLAAQQSHRDQPENEQIGSADHSIY